MFHKHYPRGDPRPKNTLEVCLSVSDESKCVEETIPKTSMPSFSRQFYSSRYASLLDVHQALIDSDILEPLYLDPFYALTRPYFWRQGLIDGACVARPCLCEECFTVSRHNLDDYELCLRRYSDRITLLENGLRLGLVSTVPQFKRYLSCF
jgi:hypothetical protein